MGWGVGVTHFFDGHIFNTQVELASQDEKSIQLIAGCFVSLWNQLTFALADPIAISGCWWNGGRRNGLEQHAVERGSN